MESAFGIDHGEVVSKIGTVPLLTGGYGIHGAVSGKKGKKVRASANEGLGAGVGGTVGAGLTGAAIGLATRGRASLPTLMGAGALGGAAGGVAGGQMGYKRNKRKGYLRPS
jgi:hypothetical protein